MKILVIQQKMIGDVLATSIVCNNLRLIYPNAQLDYLIYPFTKPVVENNPNIDNIILFNDAYRKSKVAFTKFLFSIRRTKYDMVIDAYGKLESNLIVAFSGAKTKIGFYKPYTRFIYTKAVKEISITQTNAGLAIDNRLNLIRFLNPKIELSSKPKIFLTDEEIQNGKRILEQHKVDSSKKIYMISALGSGANKTYPFVFMSEILDFIVAKTGGTLLFNYMPSQVDQANAIYNLCLAETKKNIKMDLLCNGIREFLSVTYHCDALIGNEGGAVNMAKALNIPTFTIFSPWIIKEAWNSFENGTNTVSVHLKDFKPELYSGRSPKEMKKKSLELYNSYTPDLIIPILEKYLNDAL